MVEQEGRTGASASAADAGATGKEVESARTTMKNDDEQDTDTGGKKGKEAKAHGTTKAKVSRRYHGHDRIAIILHACQCCQSEGFQPSVKHPRAQSERETVRRQTVPRKTG